MVDPIVIQLQSDCLETGTPISTLLRKAKLIAMKLGLGGTQEWLEHELNGYQCSLNDMPFYRKGMGQPKFFNPYHGWLDIVIADSKVRNMVSMAFFPHAVAEIEDMVNGDGHFVIIGFLDPIDELLHKMTRSQFNFGLHVSKSVLVGALEGIKNSVLDWAIDLEQKGILGEGLKFSSADKEKAQAVTNHIYGSNIGILGAVGNDANVSHQEIDLTEKTTEGLLDLFIRIKEASGGLPAPIAVALRAPLDQFKKGTIEKNRSIVQSAVSQMIPILQNAGGSLVAAGILSALGAG